MHTCPPLIEDHVDAPACAPRPGPGGGLHRSLSLSLGLGWRRRLSISSGRHACGSDEEAEARALRGALDGLGCCSGVYRHGLGLVHGF